MLEKRRIWWRINWKQYSKENTKIRETFWIPEQARDEDSSIKKEKKRANVATTCKTNPIVAAVLQYCSNRKIGILQDHWSHTPLQDDGNKPTMDLAQSLQTRYVRTQTWYDHVVASIRADEEAFTFSQRPSWYSDTYPETEIETETDSCQWSWTSRWMQKLSETKKRWISLRHFSRGTDHDSNEQSKSTEQSNSKKQ